MKVWAALRTWMRKALMWARRAWVWTLSCRVLRNLPNIIIVAIVAYLCAPDFFDERFDHVWSLVDPRDETASITVDIPAVHTRERLINDRNEQVSWIEEQLHLTRSQSPFPPEPQPEQALGGSPDPDTRRSAENGTFAHLKSDISSSIVLSDRPLDRFKELNAFRDVLRMERAHAMLDDRHDLDGNTLYLLSFDATVLPGRNNPGYAVISAQLLQPPEDKGQFDRYQMIINDLVGGKDALDRFNEMRLKDEFEVYLDWLDRVRLRMTDVVTATTAELAMPDSRTRASRDDNISPLEMDLCQVMVDRMAEKHQRLAEPGARRSACRRVLRQDGVRGSAEGAVVADAEKAKTRIYEAETKSTEALNQVFEMNYYDSLTKAIPALQQYVTWLIAEYPLDDHVEIWRAFTEDPGSHLPTYSAAIETCGSLKAEELRGGFPIRELAQPSASHGVAAGNATESFRLSCPSYAAVPDKLRVLALIGEALERNSSLGRGDIKIRIKQQRYDHKEMLRKIFLKPDASTDIVPAFLKEIAEWVWNGFTSGNTAFDLVHEVVGVPSISLYEDDDHWVALDAASPSCLAARIERQRFLDGAPGALGDRGHSFSEFFDARIVRRGDDCYVDVLQKLFWPETPNSGAETEERMDVAPVVATEWAHKWERFRTMLEATNDATAEAKPAAFSYGLSPRLRRGFTSGQSANTGLNLSVGDHGTEVLDTRRFNGTLYDPEIVGFTPRPAGETLELARSAGFGWVIGPQREGPGTNWRRLAVEQSQLGAFVAVPSWWRTVLLRICTGFATERELPLVPHWWNFERSSSGPEQNKSCRAHALRLPGTSAEFDRRLGMQIIRFPYIRTRADKAPEPVLLAGEPGNLLLEGGRLWRSTEVTLGAQRATRIRVLPNMEAIIAEFSCIERPTIFELVAPDSPPAQANKGKGPVFKVPIQVWTSEGTSSQQIYAFIVVPNATDGSLYCPDNEMMPSGSLGQRRSSGGDTTRR